MAWRLSPARPRRDASTPLSARDEAEDELATVPCSPASSLTLPLPSSSPPRAASSVVEVPASSPFQRKASLGTRLAPAGTLFRPPVAQPPALVDLVSSSSSDGEARGDIRPVAFKARVAAFAYRPGPPADERETNKRLRQVYDVFGDTYPSHQVRAALAACGNDLDDAILWLEQRQPPLLRPGNTTNNNKTLPKPPPPPPPPPRRKTSLAEATARKPNGRRRLVSKQALLLPGTTSSPHSPSPAMTPSPAKRPRRRLVQGLRKPNGPPSSDDPLVVIDLVESDGDAYQAEESPPPVAQTNERVMTYINTSTLKELAATTGIKEHLLEPLVAKRPFKDLAQARRVSTSKATGSRKMARISIGESAVEAVRVFLKAVSAIDEVVAKCETKAQTVKAVMDTWDLDSFGHDKQTDRDMPATPTSLGSGGGARYTRPLIPRQPTLMDGHCDMKPFQLFGLNWMWLLYTHDIGCILADEMGLGKTCQVISLVCHLVEDYERRGRDRRPWPNLVVVPPSTYNNWLMEFERFAPGVAVVGYRGTQAERAEIAYGIEQQPEACHVVLATYSQINSEADVEAMGALRLNAAIFDEGHKMKNPETKLYRDLRRIPAAWKMLLTGTPVQNNLLEMTALLSFINPKMFQGRMDAVQYIFSHKITMRDVSNGAFLHQERVRRARTMLEPFILQRRKDQVLSDMPRKIKTVVRCEMSEGQRALYDEYEALFRLEPRQRGGAKAAAGRENDQNNVWMQLRKAALHPLLFRRHFDDATVEAMARLLLERVPQAELRQPELRHLVQELKNASDFELHLWCRDYPQLLRPFDMAPAAELDSGKVRALLRLLRAYAAAGDRALVFSRFSRLVELLHEVLARAGVAHRVLTGSTGVSARQALVDEFNADARIAVFLLTTGAGGTGINLAAANKVVLFDQSENPQDDIQAENRAHRLGQTRDVEVVRLLCARSVEELIYTACQKKIALANRVTGVDEDEDGDDAGDAALDAAPPPNLEQEVREMMGQEMTPP